MGAGDHCNKENALTTRTQELGKKRRVNKARKN